MLLTIIQLLGILEKIHQKGYLHNNLNMTNICCGYDPHLRRLIHLIDFKLCSLYKDEKGTHLKANSQNVPNLNNIMFTSVNVMEGHQGSRKDDLA